MKSTITNAAEITILEPIDNNYKTGGGDISVGGCVVFANKGKPFKPMQVYGGTSNLEDYFGTPLPKKADGMEGLRHVNDAAQSCSYVQVVRVVGSKYRFPSMSFLMANDTKAEWTAGNEYKKFDVVSYSEKKYVALQDNTATTDNAPTGASESADYWFEYTDAVTHTANKYDVEVAVGSGAFLAIWPIDGDASTNRTINFTNLDETNKRFDIVLYDVDENGERYEVETHTVGVDPDDKDDMGLSAYIETVLERDSDYLNCDYNENIDWNTLLPCLKTLITKTGTTNDFTFTGGTGGDYPETQDWKQGVNVFRNERIALNLFFAAGNYDPTVLVEMADVADERHIAFFYDVPPYLKAEEALEWDADMGLKSRHARAYYSPYSATDQWRGGKTVWGVSGAMAAAKAYCNSIVTVGTTPGVHYAPAGEKRSALTRTGMKQLFPEDVINRDNFVKARINPIVGMTSGGCCCDDDLVHQFTTNYLRFGWINDVLDYIDQNFYEGARQVKFDPDGLTKQNLTDMLTTLLETLVTSGALVAPRDTERDGTSPYKLTIEQVEIDLWKATWEVCVTGAARRIAGQPKLIK